MKMIDQSWAWVSVPAESSMELIEKAGRTCYKSEDRITEDSAEKFVKMILSKGHETVIEHAGASIRLITNRGVTHELVRHRLASFSQESTRYVRYDGKMTFIRPVWWDQWSREEKGAWKTAMRQAEFAYQTLVSRGSRPEQAREVLPNSLKTEIVMTANFREWRHVFNLRCSGNAHPQMQSLMRGVLVGFVEKFPVIFGDIADRLGLAVVR